MNREKMKAELIEMAIADLHLHAEDYGDAELAGELAELLNPEIEALSEKKRELENILNYRVNDSDGIRESISNVVCYISEDMGFDDEICCHTEWTISVKVHEEPIY